jgi:hypothetical protein
MMTQRIAVGITVVNLVLMVVLLAQMRPLTAQGVAPVLRGRALEIVDDKGRLRATLNIQPANSTHSEIVLFRLINERQRPAVKISTSEEGSGLMLAGGASTHETYSVIDSTGTTNSLKLKNEDGRQQLIQP